METIKMDSLNGLGGRGGGGGGGGVRAASHGATVNDRNLCFLNIFPFKNYANENQKGKWTLSSVGFNRGAGGPIRGIYVNCHL